MAAEDFHVAVEEVGDAEDMLRLAPPKVSSVGLKILYLTYISLTTEVGEIMHACQEELVCKCTLNEQVPYFNGRIFVENKQEIGKIDEILGPIHQFVSITSCLLINSHWFMRYVNFRCFLLNSVIL